MHPRLWSTSRFDSPSGSLTTSSRALAALLLLALPAFTFLLAGQGAAQDAKEKPFAVCRHADLDGGASRAIDLADVRRAYDRLRDDVGKALKAQRQAAVAKLELAHDAALSRCGSRAKRRATLKEALPAELRGRVFWLVAVPDGGQRIRQEDAIRRDERAEVLVVSARRPADAAALAKRLKRPVTFGTKELANALGATCAPARIEIGENGRDLTIDENPD